MDPSSVHLILQCRPDSTLDLWRVFSLRLCNPQAKGSEGHCDHPHGTPPRGSGDRATIWLHGPQLYLHIPLGQGFGQDEGLGCGWGQG